VILGVNNYDPDAEEGRRGSGHVTKRELLIYAIALGVAAFLLIPVYNHLMEIRNSHICTQNLLDIGTAIEGYAEDNDDRFPPVYMVAEDQVGPHVFGGNSVVSWATVISQYMKKKESFKCPAAQPDEGVQNLASDNGANIVSDYGMYAAFSTVGRGSVSQISGSALIADSDNGGANGTLDPLPLKDSKGNRVPDGMVIGLDNTNFTDEDRSQHAIDTAKYATRLAAPGSVNGLNDSTLTRHPDGINVLMADLHRQHIPGAAAMVEHPSKAGAGITGLWYVPPAP
jgi:prepilin-type processing-associated H-X9-DG protein